MVDSNMIVRVRDDCNLVVSTIPVYDYTASAMCRPQCVSNSVALVRVELSLQRRIAEVIGRWQWC